MGIIYVLKVFVRLPLLMHCNSHPPLPPPLSPTLFYPTPPFFHPLLFRFPLFQLLHVVHLEGVLLKKFS